MAQRQSTPNVPEALGSTFPGTKEPKTAQTNTQCPSTVKVCHLSTEKFIKKMSSKQVTEGQALF